MRTESRLLIAPTVEPISLDDARMHLRLGDPDLYSDDDVWLLDAIPAARELCEGWLERSLAPQTRLWTGVPLIGSIALPYGPVLSVDAISYDDESGAGQVMPSTGYVFGNGAVIPTGEWPNARQLLPSMRITYQTGFDARGQTIPIYPLPRAIRSAILLSLGHLYENREATSTVKPEELSFGVKRLLEPFRFRISIA